MVRGVEFKSMKAYKPQNGWLDEVKARVRPAVVKVQGSLNEIAVYLAQFQKS